MESGPRDEVGFVEKWCLGEDEEDEAEEADRDDGEMDGGKGSGAGLLSGVCMNE